MIKGGSTARLALLFRMVDEGIVSFSVAAGFLVAVPLCAVQGSWIVEWSFGMFVATWVLAFLTAYPFVCVLLNTCYLTAPPDDAVRAAAGKRMEAATIFAGAFGVLCAALLTVPSHVDSAVETGPVDGLAIVGVGMLACLAWYAAARFLPRVGEPSASTMPALAALLVASTAFGLLCTVCSGLVWKALVMLYPFNLLLILAKHLRTRLHERRRGRARRLLRR